MLFILLYCLSLPPQLALITSLLATCGIDSARFFGDILALNSTCSLYILYCIRHHLYSFGYNTCSPALHTASVHILSLTLPLFLAPDNRYTKTLVCVRERGKLWARLPDGWRGCWEWRKRRTTVTRRRRNVQGRMIFRVPLLQPEPMLLKKRMRRTNTQLWWGHWAMAEAHCYGEAGRGGGLLWRFNLYSEGIWYVTNFIFLESSYQIGLRNVLFFSPVSTSAICLIGLSFCKWWCFICILVLGQMMCFCLILTPMSGLKRWESCFWFLMKQYLFHLWVIDLKQLPLELYLVNLFFIFYLPL